MKKTLLAFLSLMLINPVFSQINLKTAKEYKKNIPKYENWLQSNNLENFLSVNDFAKVEDRELFQLYLEFKTDFDSVEVYWNTIDRKLHKERGYGLDSLLYFAAINAFEIPPDNFNIIIYDNYIETPLDTVALYYDKNKKSIESYISFSNARGQTADRVVSLGGNGDSDAVIELGGFDESRVALYKKIIKILEDYYKPIIKDDFKKNFTKHKDEEADELHIFVTRLKGQILKDESNPWLAEMSNYFLNSSLDWRRVERLEIKVNLKYKNKHKLNLQVWIEAMYGSGIWGVENWKMAQNYEPEFEFNVRSYANKIANVIKEELQNN